MRSCSYLRFPFVLLAASFLGACQITIDGETVEEWPWRWDWDQRSGFSEMPERDVASVERKEGHTSSFTLSYGESNDPSLLRVDRISEPIAYLGITTQSLDRELAESLEIQPWSGVRVRRVPLDTPAAEAGLAVGDVLRSVGGLPLTSAEQFSDIIATGFAPGQVAKIGYSRFSSADGWVELDAEVTLAERIETRRESQRIELATSAEIEHSTGVQLAEIPPQWREEVFGEGAAQVLVSGVWLGSPGYTAGLRSGDRIETWNGLAVSSLSEIESAASAPNGEHVVEVTGRPGDHTASFGTADLEQRSSFHIPILASYKRTIDHKRISFLDFIFQFGFNYRSYVLPSATREPAKSTELSILPLGMFEFTRSPERSRNRIFWFIRWGSDAD